MASSPFSIRAVVEGFYGVFYTFPERNDLIRFAGQHGFNRYIYSPKNDRQHRNRWWEPYPQKIMEQFGETVAVAKAANVDFCYALGSGVSMCYSSPEDFKRVTEKYLSFYQCGVRDFSILLDDISLEFRHELDRCRYQSHSEAHADFCNRLYAWLQSVDSSCTLSMCPTDYFGSWPFSSYLVELGKGLHPEIDFFYTGPEVCSPAISTTDTANYAQAARRKPIIWDNYPVNDLSMRAELHLGPIHGRSADLFKEVKGIAVNLMIQAEASKVPLITYARFLLDPTNYNPQLAWQQALQEVAGEESYPHFLRFAENSLFSCLGDIEAARLDDLTQAALSSLRAGESALASGQVRDLDSYLIELDEACYHLLNRMDNLALRANIIPWIEQLDNWTQMARNGIRILRAFEAGEPIEGPLHFFSEYLEFAKTHPKRIAGQVLLPFADYVSAQIQVRKHFSSTIQISARDCLELAGEQQGPNGRPG